MAEEQLECLQRCKHSLGCLTCRAIQLHKYRAMRSQLAKSTTSMNFPIESRHSIRATWLTEAAKRTANLGVVSEVTYGGSLGLGRTGPGASPTVRRRRAARGSAGSTCTAGSPCPGPPAPAPCPASAPRRTRGRAPRCGPQPPPAALMSQHQLHHVDESTPTAPR
jgi:hypothetical protein